MTKKTIRIKGIEESIPVSEGTTFQDLACRFSGRYGSPIMAVKSGNSLFELCRLVGEEKEIEFVDLSSLDGIRIYTRGAIFILFMAVRELLGKVSLDVHHSRGSGLICEIEGVVANRELLEKIEEKMREIAQENVPFIKDTIGKF